MNVSYPTSAFDGLLAVENVNTGKLLVRERIQNVNDAQQVYLAMREGDRESAVNRLQIQASLDGVPPYNQGKLNALKRGYQANVNFNFMEDALSIAQAPFDDLLEEEVLVTTPTNYGTDPEMKIEWSQIIAEEMTKLITQVDGFEYDYPEMVRQFLLHGVSVPYFPDEIGFQWETAAMGDFLIPRGVRAKARAVEVACAMRPYLPNELYHHIEDRAVAEDMGWNVDEVIRQIKAAQPDQPVDWDIEHWEKEWKNNDIGMTAKSKVIRSVHMWVTSLDGQVSHYIFAEQNPKDFMYKCLGRFKKQSEAYTMMTYGVGTNGCYHGIRGLGYVLYGPVRQLNMLWSGLLDQIRQSGKLLLQPNSENDLQNLSMVDFGGSAVVVPPNVKLLTWSWPNLQNSTIPGLEMISNMVRQKAGRYTSEADFNQAKEQTRAEVMARVDQISKLSISQLRIFKQGMTRLVREQARRIKRKDWTEHDRNGADVLRFYARCALRGVPKEAIHAIDLEGVEFVLGIGNGSAAARTAILERLELRYSYMDEVGKNNYNRDYVRTIAGLTAANSYFPKQAGQRPPIDLDIAITENSIFRLGGDKPVIPNEIHSVHIPPHLELMLEYIEGYEAMQIPIEVAIPTLQKLRLHTQTHLDYIQSHPNVGAWDQALQQTGEIIDNGAKKLEKMQRDQAEAEARGEVYTPEQQVIGLEESNQNQQAIEALKAALTEKQIQKIDQEMAIKQQQHEQNMAKQDILLAQSVRQSRKKSQTKR